MTKQFYRGQKRTIVSSFFSPGPKQGHEDSLHVGVLLREEILSADPVDDGHLLVYLRRFVRDNVLEALEQCGRSVFVYGLGRREDTNNLTFCEVDEFGFLEHLIHCHALISNAGNQLVGEALYLKKPVLAFPESGNFEQAINAHFLRQSGMGDWISDRLCSLEQLQQFLSQVETFRSRVVREDLCGNEATVEAVLSFLPTSPAHVQRLLSA